MIPQKRPADTANDVVAEAKKRIQELFNKTRIGVPLPSQGQPSSIQSGGLKGSSAGLGASSSSITGSAAKSTFRNTDGIVSGARSMPSKFSVLSRPAAPVVNPYISTTPGPTETIRKPRSFAFVRPGSKIEEGDAARQAIELQQLKERIEQKSAALLASSSAGSAGPSDKSLRFPPPPDVEWWDTDIPELNSLIHHPINVAFSKPEPGIRAIKLTKKEAKAWRKKTRQDERQERQDQIKMGLLPPETTKVKMSNMVRVLANAAVSDPTALELKVKGDILKRKQDHVKANHERMTSKEDRQKRELEKLEEEERVKGTQGMSFKIKTLANKSHRFKVRVNALQLHLTGVCIVHPDFAIVYVEGTERNLKAYLRLMTERIKWTESSTILESGAEENTELKAEDKAAADQRQLQNTCDLLWTGKIRHRHFKNFWAKQCPTEHLAKESLGEMSGQWDLARNFNKAQDE